MDNTLENLRQIANKQATRTVQEIFDTVISYGMYADTTNMSFDKAVHKHMYMCLSLREAWTLGRITIQEWDKADKAIENLLNSEETGFHTLAAYLRANGRDDRFPARLAIYKNWDTWPTNGEE